MKSIENKLVIFLLAAVVCTGLGLSSCSTEEDMVEPKTMEEYKTQLSDLVASEKTIVQNCVVGYNKGDFRSPENYADFTYNYMKVLVEAEAVLAKADLTIAEIIAASETLAGPGDAFTSSLFISDRRPLHELIVVSDTLRVHTPAGTEPGQVPLEAREAFIEVITEAKGVRSSAVSIERQVLEAVEKLGAAKEVFEAAIIK